MANDSSQSIDEPPVGIFFFFWKKEGWHISFDKVHKRLLIRYHRLDQGIKGLPQKLMTFAIREQRQSKKRTSRLQD